MSFLLKVIVVPLYPFTVRVMLTGSRVSILICVRFLTHSRLVMFEPVNCKGWIIPLSAVPFPVLATIMLGLSITRVLLNVWVKLSEAITVTL